MSNPNQKKIVAIIQARIGSTRLPNKVMKPLCGKPILWHVWNRLFYAKNIDQIVIATTTLSEDDAIQFFCEENDIAFSRGSSDDVLSRYYNAASNFNADVIIRITSDCPVIDPEIVDQIIASFLSEKADYMSNVFIRHFPRGLDTEIFTFQALEKAHQEAAAQREREHVTPYIYLNPNKFSIKNFAAEKDYSKYRWTVDTPEDFKLIEIIYNSLYPTKEIFLLKDVLELFEANPTLININQHIEQKKLGE